MATFWRRLLDEGLERYLASFDPPDAYIPCPRCGDRLDDLAERSERLCRPCMLELMDITPEELDRYLAEKYPDPDKTLTLVRCGIGIHEWALIGAGPDKRCLLCGAVASKLTRGGEG